MNGFPSCATANTNIPKVGNKSSNCNNNQVSQHDNNNGLVYLEAATVERPLFIMGHLIQQQELLSSLVWDLCMAFPVFYKDYRFPELDRVNS